MPAIQYTKLIQQLELKRGRQLQALAHTEAEIHAIQRLQDIDAKETAHAPKLPK